MGCQQRNTAAGNSDRAQCAENARRESGPTQEMLLCERKVVRVARVKDGGKPGRVRRQVGAARRVQANPDHDLTRSHGDGTAGHKGCCMPLEERQLSQDGGHVRGLCRHGLGVDQFCRVDLVGHFRFDAADDELVIVPAPAVALLIQLELRASETDAIFAVVSNPLPVVGLEQFRQVAPEGGLRTRDHGRDFIRAGCHVDAHELPFPDCCCLAPGPVLLIMASVESHGNRPCQPTFWIPAAPHLFSAGNAGRMYDLP